MNHGHDDLYEQKLFDKKVHELWLYFPYKENFD